MSNSDFLSVLLFSAVGIALLIVLGKVLTNWFFKVDQNIELQKLQVKHLKRIADKLEKIEQDKELI